MNSSNQNDWYVIRTKYQQEFKAALNLEAQEFEVYLPQFIKNRKISPLFPGYLFVHMNHRLNISKIMYTKGVHNFVKFGGWYASITDKIIKQIKEKEIETATKASELLMLQKGDKVEILDGPFKGLNAIFEEYSESDRVKVLFELLNNKQKVELKEKFVKIIQRA